MTKIAAFFDIDGTIYREGLITEVFKKIIKYELIEEDERKEWGYCIYQMKEGKMTLENQEIL